MKTVGKILAVTFCLLMAFGGVTGVFASATEETSAEEVTLKRSGDCGASGSRITWAIDDEGTVTVKGKGDMATYYYFTDSPFYPLTDSIKSVVVEKGVKSIGDYAFAGCSSLESVTLPETVKIIKSSAFSECKSLKEIAIPKSVTTIESGAFSDCSSLNSITVTGSVTDIHKDSFLETAFMKNYSNWENDVLYLGDCLLAAKNTVSGEYEVKEGTRCIADCAFADCDKITELTVPASVKCIGITAFAGIINVKYDGKPAVPENYWGAKCVNGFAEEGIYYKDSSKKTVLACLPDTKGEITLPDTVTVIGEEAFLDCDDITNITIPDTVRSVGSGAFAGTGFYKNRLYWEKGALYVGKCLVQVPEYLNDTFIIKAGTKVIADGVFTDSEVAEVTIPGSVQHIGKNAFNNCYNIFEITIPGSVKSIGDGAFRGCTGLSEIIIPDSVTSIGSYAFADCEDLKTVTVPASVKKIGTAPFNECEELREIIVDRDNPEYCSEDGVLFTKDMTEILQYPPAKDDRVYNIPDSVIVIGDYSFDGCDAIEEVSIPDSVTTIGCNTFGCCNNITSLKIPYSVTSLGNLTRWIVRSRIDIYYESIEEDWENILAADFRLPDNAKVHFAKERPESKKNGRAKQSPIFAGAQGSAMEGSSFNTGAVISVAAAAVAAAVVAVIVIKKKKKALSDK